MLHHLLNTHMIVIQLPQPLFVLFHTISIPPTKAENDKSVPKFNMQMDKITIYAQTQFGPYFLCVLRSKKIWEKTLIFI